MERGHEYSSEMVVRDLASALESAGYSKSPYRNAFFRHMDLGVSLLGGRLVELEAQFYAPYETYVVTYECQSESDLLCVLRDFYHTCALLHSRG
jgi:hypothetical protein